MLSPRAKWNIQRIAPFGIIWLLLGWVFLLIEHVAIGPTGNGTVTAVSMNREVFLFASIAVLLVGLIIGMIELFLLDPLFQGYSFTRKVIYKLVIYILVMSLVILITYPIALSLELGMSVSDPIIWRQYQDYFTSSTNASTMLQMGVSMFASLLYSEMSAGLGQRVLMNFFTGKYHHPVEEERIFMFLDMRSSTSIAENLGHIRYFELLKQFFKDLTDPIIDHAGQIYQYVGDEVVVTWPADMGTENNNCIRCFFAMRTALEKKSGKYESEFGTIPDFKAGIHIGKVTTGEIGVMKKEITYSGDVLNTAARIQGLCNELGVNLLVSEDLLNELQPSTDHRSRDLGIHSLRGRHEEIRLFTLDWVVSC